MSMAFSKYPTTPPLGIPNCVNLQAYQADLSGSFVVAVGTQNAVMISDVILNE